MKFNAIFFLPLICGQEQVVYENSPSEYEKFEAPRKAFKEFYDPIPEPKFRERGGFKMHDKDKDGPGMGKNKDNGGAMPPMYMAIFDLEKAKTIKHYPYSLLKDAPIPTGNSDIDNKLETDFKSLGDMICGAIGSEMKTKIDIKPPTANYVMSKTACLFQIPGDENPDDAVDWLTELPIVKSVEGSSIYDAYEKKDD